MEGKKRKHTSEQENKAKAQKLTEITWNGFKEIAVEGQQLNEEGLFPLALSPTTEGPIEDLQRSLVADSANITSALTKHGAILFRGCPLSTAEDFLAFLEPFKFRYGDYIGGGGPRSVVLGPIHNSTETPADFKIPFHHELAYLTKTPGKLLFFCHTPPKEDGETPILLSNRLYRKLKEQNPKFVNTVAEKKVIYTRVLADKGKCDHKIQRSWQEVYATTDRKDAEEKAVATGTETVEWLDDDSMKVVSKPLDAVVVDPRTQKETWFNSVVLLHPATQKEKKNVPWQVTYGDGNPIKDEDVLQAHKLMDENMVIFKWEKGDVLIVDNKLALHARSRFTPPRLILAAIAD